MLGLLRYVDGDLADEATYKAMSDEIGSGEHVLYYLEVPPFLFGRIAQGIAAAGRARGARVMVEKPFGTDLASSVQLNDTMHEHFPRRRSSGSTTGWPSTRWKTSCSPGSPTRCSSRCSAAPT